MMSSLRTMPGAWEETPESSIVFSGERDSQELPPSPVTQEPAQVDHSRDISNSNVVQHKQPKPIIIAVFGQTGTGKTSFIKAATGQDLQIGHSLSSCTEDVLPVKFKFGNREIVLVDTPGFSDTNMSDTEVLERIAGWMADTYEDDLLLSGIIYMHRIIDPRMDGPSLRNLRMMRTLCGSDSLKNVVLTTTMWEKVTEEEGQRREDELKTNFWKPMIEGGSRTARMTTNTNSDAIQLVKMFLKNKPVPTRIQQELHAGTELSQTEAAGEIRQEINKVLIKWKKEVDSVRKEMQEAIRTHDLETQRALKGEIEEAKNNVLKLEREKVLLEAAKPRRLPRVKSKGFFGPHWNCLTCNRRTPSIGTWSCRDCNNKQRNIW